MGHLFHVQVKNHSCSTPKAFWKKIVSIPKDVLIRQRSCWKEESRKRFPFGYRHMHPINLFYSQINVKITLILIWCMFPQVKIAWDPSPTMCAPPLVSFQVKKQKISKVQSPFGDLGKKCLRHPPYNKPDRQYCSTPKLLQFVR